MKFQDVKLTRTEPDCFYDLTLDDDGDFQKVNSFETALLLSIFCERRASVTEVPDTFRRRGWIGNINRPVEYGSKLWLLEQARLTNATVNAARTYLEQALQWLIDFNYLDEIVVTATRNREDIIQNFVADRCLGVIVQRDLETQAILAQIVLIIEGSEELRRNVVLWENTTF